MDETFPELTITFQPPKGRQSLVDANADLIRIANDILSILPEGDLTYELISRHVHTFNSWSGHMVNYQEPVTEGSRIMGELRGYFGQYTAMRLTDVDHTKWAEIYVFSQPPHAAKQWRVKLGDDVICLDQVVPLSGFIPDQQVFTFDDLLTREQQRIRDILRQYCFWNA
jgi:hypothetical protein